MNLSNDILILGLGNEILSDDGIGIKLVEKLMQKKSILHIDYKTASVGGLELIDIISGYELVIIIDAIKTPTGTPASVYHFVPDDFFETLHLTNLHDISFLTALKVCRELDIKLPSTIHIIAIEIIEDRLFSNDFTPAIHENFNEILQNAENITTEILTEYFTNRLANNKTVFTSA